MSSLLLLNSRDAVTPNATNDEMQFQINSARMNLLHGFSMTLVSAELPNGVYPLNSFYNTIAVSEAGGAAATITATITASNYTGATLAAHLKTILDAASVAQGNSETYTVSYDSATKKLTFSATGNFAFVAVANSAYEALGITTLGGSTASPVVADYPINISGSAYVDLASNFHVQNWNSTSTSNIIARIPLSGAFGDVINVSFPESLPLVVSGPSISDLHLRLLDDQGNPWRLPPNFHLSLVFRIDPIQGKHANPHSANRVDYGSAYSSLGQRAVIVAPK